jgi:3-phenylpropionate/cinnamic acid dioxygenase small subunit
MMDEAVRRRVEALLAHYVDIVDQDRLEEWPDLFVDDCRYRVTSALDYRDKLPHGVIYAVSKGMLRDRVSALREANVYEAQRYRHIVGPIWIEDETSGVVRSRSNFLVIRTMHTGEMLLFAAGTYFDKIDVSADPCRFIERVVVTDSDKIDTLLAIPL